MSFRQVDAEEAKQLKTLEATIKAAEKELRPLQASAKGLQDRAAELQAKIEHAGGEPLKRKKKAIADIQEVCRYQREVFIKCQSHVTEIHVSILACHHLGLLDFVTLP